MKMAQQQAPPAAQAPIVVVVDEVQITSDAALVLAPGAQHVKGHASFLAWATAYDQSGGVINYTLGRATPRAPPRLAASSAGTCRHARSSMGITF